jgi:hypothetical protein
MHWHHVCQQNAIPTDDISRTTLRYCGKPQQLTGYDRSEWATQSAHSIQTTRLPRHFRVTAIHADPEFEPLQPVIGHIQFNFCAQNEHVPEIECFIRTVKDRARSGYNSLPFKRIPRLILIRLVSNAVFWLNAFPHRDGASSTLSPRYLLTGKHLDYVKHVRAEFSAYVQTHEEHSNNMNARILSAICLGPSGNEQGGHWFLSLSTGKRIHHHKWTDLPSPDDAINRVNTLA